MKKLSILIVEDNETDSEWVERALLQESEQYRIWECVKTLASAKEILKRNFFDLIVLDMKLPDCEGLELFEKIQSLAPRSAIILLTGNFKEESIAVDAMKRGAQEYLYKGDASAALLNRCYARERFLLLQQLKEKTEELEQFATRIAHDLKSPLVQITGFINLLAADLEGKLSEDSESYIKFIQERAPALSQLIEAVLSYSKLGGKIPRQRPESLQVSLDNALRHLKPELESKKAKIINETPLPTASFEPALIESVFHNLIGNAVKYCEEEQPVVTITHQRQNSEWVISIKDNGIGIDPRYSDQIFEFLNRLHSESQYSGFGVGLASCKKIIESHSGRIWVDSTLGQGSTFHFSLPLNGLKSIEEEG